MNNLSLNTFETWINEVVAAQYEKGKTEMKAWPWKAPAKNRDFKEKFHQKMLDRKCGYWSRYSGNFLTGESEGKENREFLYDFSWVKWCEDGEDKNILQDVLMVMELEFSDGKMLKGKRGGIKFDFHKLLQADAPYKLMGFQMPQEAEVKEAIDDMKRAVDLYQSKASADILVFGWAYNDGPKKDNRRQFIFERIQQQPK